METTSMVRVKFNIEQELAAKNYETVIEYADETQRELLYSWNARDNTMLERLILQSRNILNFWVDSIGKRRQWMALVRCGAWIGTLETLEKSIYEESMDLLTQKQKKKRILAIKHVPEIMGLLEVKGVMAHGELAEELHLKHASTLTEIMKKTENLELIEISKAGKYKLYSLTDTGVRYAKQLRSRGDRQALLKGIIREYGLRMDEAALDSFLESADDKMTIELGQTIKVKMEGGKYQSGKLDRALTKMHYDEELQVATEEKYLYLEKRKKISDYQAEVRAYG